MRYIPIMAVLFVLAGCTFAPIPELGFDGLEIPSVVDMACEYLEETFPGEECVTD